MIDIEDSNQPVMLYNQLLSDFIFSQKVTSWADMAREAGRISTKERALAVARGKRKSEQLSATSIADEMQAICCGATLLDIDGAPFDPEGQRQIFRALVTEARENGELVSIFANSLRRLNAHARDTKTQTTTIRECRANIQADLVDEVCDQIERMERYGYPSPRLSSVLRLIKFLNVAHKLPVEVCYAATATIKQHMPLETHAQRHYCQRTRTGSYAYPAFAKHEL